MESFSKERKRKVAGTKKVQPLKVVQETHNSEYTNGFHRHHPVIMWLGSIMVVRAWSEIFFVFIKHRGFGFLMQGYELKKECLKKAWFRSVALGSNLCRVMA